MRRRSRARSASSIVHRQPAVNLRATPSLSARRQQKAARRILSYVYEYTIICISKKWRELTLYMTPLQGLTSGPQTTTLAYIRKVCSCLHKPVIIPRMRRPIPPDDRLRSVTPMQTTANTDMWKAIRSQDAVKPLPAPCRRFGSMKRLVPVKM